MALLKIARLGNPVLRRIAEPVDVNAVVSDPEHEIHEFIDDLTETMHHEGGVGIAAPQVGRSLQIIVVEYQENERYTDQESIPLQVFFNPVVTRFGGEPRSFWEGCLSLKEFRGLVTRPSEVTVEAFDREGKPVTIEAEGFLAIVLQHEVDHLHGKVFIDRIADMTRLAYNEEFQTFWVEEGAEPTEV